MVAGQAQRYPDMGQAVSVTDLIDLGQGMIDQVRAAYPEVLCDVELECDEEATRLLNSRGLNRYYVDTTLSGFLDAEWIRGDDFLSVGDGQTSRNGIDQHTLVDQVLQRLAWAEHNATISSGRLPVIFTAKAADMLWGTFQSALSGKRALERSSPWSDALGDLVCSQPLLYIRTPRWDRLAAPLTMRAWIPSGLPLLSREC
jgi:PmbA protein